MWYGGLSRTGGRQKNGWTAGCQVAIGSSSVTPFDDTMVECARCMCLDSGAMHETFALQSGRLMSKLLRKGRHDSRVATSSFTSQGKSALATWRVPNASNVDTHYAVVRRRVFQLPSGGAIKCTIRYLGRPLRKGGWRATGDGHFDRAPTPRSPPLLYSAPRATAPVSIVDSIHPISPPSTALRAHYTAPSPLCTILPLAAPVL
jgi:hypothetical protein